MYKKILICAVIALVLVPTAVMAAGFGGNTAAAAPGQGQCVQDGQRCNQSFQQAGAGEQFRSGTRQGTGAGQNCTGDCPCTGDQKQTRSMLRLHDGSCGNAKASP